MASPARARSRKPRVPQVRPWTRADLARLPDDGNRYEVLDGQLLVTPQASHDHQRVAFAFAMAIEQYVGPHGAAYVVGPGAVPFGENELQPDVQVIPGPRQSATWDSVPAPVLVIEVLSTATRHRDFGVKLDAYLGRGGVPTMWIVDHRKREVHVIERGGALRIERQTLAWQAPGVPVALHINLPEFFLSALGE